MMSRRSMQEFCLELSELLSDSARLVEAKQRISDLESKIANLQAAKPAETCNYPDCNCPFDAPADPSWCARGLPKASSETDAEPNTAANRLMGEANSGVPNNPVLADSATTADALGSLPVVAYEVQPRYEDCDGYFDYMKNDGSAHKLVEKGWKVLPLTDHAQATAEIAKRDAWRKIAEEHLGFYLSELVVARAKLAGVDGLVEALKGLLDDTQHSSHNCGDEFCPVDRARAALATYEAAQGEKGAAL